jgi:hypothetical protein
VAQERAEVDSPKPVADAASVAERLEIDPASRENLERILRSPSYLLAENDVGFLKRSELRPTRLQLELLKPEMIQQEQNIISTIVVFGGTRILEKPLAERRLAQAEAALRAAPHDPRARRAVDIARRVLAKAHYYEEARELGRLASSSCQVNRRCEFVVVTGGGPGVMEAANRGAYEVGCKSIGLNITLPMEQTPNPYITPELCFQFHYFAIRKMHFLMRAKALVAFPGGFGTMDELFETLTLVQTGKMTPLPIILFGRAYWERVINFDFLVEEGTIAPRDRALMQYADTAAEAWRIIMDFQYQAPAPPGLMHTPGS